MVGWYHLKTGQNGSDFKWHLKTGPFEDRTCLDHSNTGLVRYSDGYCTFHSILDHFIQLLIDGIIHVVPFRDLTPFVFLLTYFSRDWRNYSKEL